MTEPDPAAPDQPAPRPRPQYGEYAPPGWVPPHLQDEQQERSEFGPPPTAAPAAGAPPAGATAADTGSRSASMDRTWTMALLGVGLFGMLIGVYGGLQLPVVISQAAVMQNSDVTVPDWVAPAGIAVAIGQLVLYAFAVSLSLARLRRRQRAFWVPLVAGVCAAILYHSVTGAAGVAAGLVATLPGG